jgi:formamidase
MAAARDAVRAMIDLIGRDYGLAPELANCLCSTAVDLRLAEVGNVANYVVAAHLPRGIFR